MITPDRIGSCSGGYLYDRMLATHLIRSGDEVRVRALKDYPGDENLKDLADELIGKRPDLIIQDELSFAVLQRLNRMLSHKYAGSIVSIVHNLTASLETDRDASRSKGEEEGAYFQGVDAIVANSGWTARSIRELARVRSKVHVAIPGKDHILYERRHYNNEEEEISIFCAGNLVPNKGMLELVGSLRSLDRGWSLRIAGRKDADPDYTVRLAEAISYNGFQDRVRLLGLLKTSELASAYRSADVYAMPSYHEGLGISYIEALGFGLPVVATSRGGPPEIITDGVEGYLVDPFDPDRLTDRLSQLSNDPALRLRMGESARKRFQGLPTWNDSMGSVRDYLLALNE